MILRISRIETEFVEADKVSARPVIAMNEKKYKITEKRLDVK